ncbi:hypothetical protein L486_04893 [Kwoniella mangroviensis CBS 10435]|uniref:Uncharacterized protein n=1 Tax=Kwoniella mangroviensis CBS 10435 TaxID=1331196 RepID=A0A1B9IPD0_9TREE|nr:hypothetical protein L486_04893 [Kwoniella mangroviensis CBS 10435]
MGSEYVDDHYFIDKRGRSPSQRMWDKTSTLGKIIYLIYVIPLFAILISVALLLSPFYLFIRKTRPLLPSTSLPDPSTKYIDKTTGKKRYSKYEWFGEDKEFPLYTLFVPLGKGPGLHRRTWEMFNYFIESYKMVLKQGLQAGGCLTAIIVGYMQVRMMIHDLNDPTVVDYSQEMPLINYDPAERLRTDSECAYGVGTGIANWANGKEPLAWYTLYHIFILILCICLFGDELLNVRFGCFAPQWFRAGNGYTIMFLAAATLSISPNWDYPETVQFRYLILVIIFIFGLYNVLRTLITSIGCSTSGYKHLDYRVGRKPLRFWTDSEWQDEYYRMNFIQPGKHERYFWTEHLQAKIGDWDFPLERRSREDIKAQIAHQKKMDPKYDDGRIQKVWQKSGEDLENQRGRLSRVVIHGGPKKMHDNFKRELEEMKRIHVPPNDPDNPPDEEMEKEIIKALDKDKGYFGIANWKPRTKSFGWWWFDVRRGYYMICAFGLFFLRIGICCFDLAAGTFYQYLEEYNQASNQWKINGGPSNDTCQYYKGSSVPIFILPGGNAYSGVIAMYIWVGVWNTFLLGMCLAIFMVAISNNMWWGMHIGFLPITLIGPRMTSMSLGITLGFVALATLQQGFYFHNDAGIIFTKIVCYASIAGAALSIYPNEPLRPNFTRDPFWPWTSRFAFRRMDRKKWHYENKDMQDMGQ